MLEQRCSKEGCPTQNTAEDRTVSCHRCKSLIHLTCYGINKPAEEIFITKNVVILCNECVQAEFNPPSPKRKTTVPSSKLDSMNIGLTGFDDETGKPIKI